MKDILEAIIDKVETPSKEHGSFVTYMAERNYAGAAFHADSDNAANMCQLIKYREWLDMYGIKWLKLYIANGAEGTFA